jgi:cysteine desulfurase
VTGLRDRFERAIAELVPGVRVHAAAAPWGRLPTASSLTFPGVDGPVLLAGLDLEGIAASTGSACASGAARPSRVLEAMGLAPADVRATLRFSFGRTTSGADIERIVSVLPSLVARVRAIPA